MNRIARQRLTITLASDVLKNVDAAIDGVNVRNRSHAIEHLIKKATNTRIAKAVVLAGGNAGKTYGTSDTVHKSMLRIGTKPVLGHLLEQLHEHDVNDVIIVTDRHGHAIKAHFGDGADRGLQIAYVDEQESRGTARALAEAAPMLTEPFFLFYSDVLIDLNLNDMARSHRDTGATATIALTSVDDPSRYGSLRLHGNRVVEFSEKPKKTDHVSRMVNAGVYCMSPKIFSFIPKTSYATLETDVFPKLITEQSLFGYPFEGQWFDVGTPAVFERAVREWRDSLSAH